MLDLPEDVDDVHVDNAPVRTMKHGGLTVEGYSRAAMQSYWRVPELKVGFDFGLQPWSFMATPSWCVSHCHLDHIAAMPAYVSRRRLMRMSPPVIYLPDDDVEEVDRMLASFERLDGCRMNCRLIGCRPNDEFELSREHVLTVFETFHTVPSVGYMIWDRRRKLREEYLGLPGERIRDLRLSGVEVTDEVRVPLVAYLGDSDPRAFDRCPDLFRAKVLITEVTFFDPHHRRERIHKYGHIHLDDVIERAEAFQNELIIACHFSTRYHDDQIVRFVERRLPERLKSRFQLWI